MAALNSDPHDDAADPTLHDSLDRPSKTAQKKAMHELQALGEALMALPDARIDAIGLPESLRDAVRMAQRTKTFEGKRRQIQYLGKLMRRADAEPIREAVAAFQLGHARDSLALHQAERWRAELIAEDTALDRWHQAHPGTDLQQLRSLIRSARRDATKPASGPQDGSSPRQSRAHRELFQWVKAALAAHGRGDNGDSGDNGNHDSDNHDHEPND